MTLQDLKNIVDAAEQGLNEKGIEASEVPIQKDFFNQTKEIRIDVNNYLGHYYLEIEIN